MKEEKTTVRLYPKTDPEKTEGVLTALSMVGKLILDVFPDAHVTKTNIEKMKEVNWMDKMILAAAIAGIGLVAGIFAWVQVA